MCVSVITSKIDISVDNIEPVEMSFIDVSCDNILILLENKLQTFNFILDIWNFVYYGGS